MQQSKLILYFCIISLLSVVFADESDVENASRQPALIYDGTVGQHMVLENPPVFGEHGFTVSAWMRFEEEPEVGLHPCLFSSMSPEASFQVSLTNMRRIQIVVFTAEGFMHEYESHNPQLTPKQWHHVAVMYHQVGGVRVAIDGLGNVTPLVRQLLLFKGRLKEVNQALLLGACSVQPDASEYSGTWVGAISYPQVLSERLTVDQVRKSMYDLSPGASGVFEQGSGGSAPHLVPNSWAISEPKARLAEKHRDISGNPSHFQITPRDYTYSGTNEHQYQQQLDDPRAPVVIIRPFIKSQVPLLIWNMEKWSTSNFYPCGGASGAGAGISRSNTARTARAPLSPSNVDIVFYYNRDLADEPTIESDLRNAIEEQPALRKCFREIKFMSAKLSSVRDNHPDGPCWQFYQMFESEDIVDNYRFAFVMEPDVQPIRPFWIDRLLQEVEFAKIQDYWVKGSLSHCEGNYAFMDFHINGNALYKLGDSGFNRFIKDTWQYFLLSEQESRPGGCAGGMGGHDHAMFLYLTSDENYPRVHKIFHKFSYTSFIVNYCIFEYRPWTTIRRYPHAYFVHSSWANFKNVWDRSEHDYMMVSDLDNEWNQAVRAGVISEVNRDARLASELMASVNH